MSLDYSFIIIDDSELDRYVTQKFLVRTSNGFIIKTFHDAEQALEIIGESHDLAGSTPVIILLDLQMPYMNGFQFVEEFEKLSAEIQKQYMIIVLTVLSSNSDPNDIQRIFTHKTVKSVIEKPLTKEKLNALLELMESNN